MADRLIANSLGKYLSVFIKNWSKDALSLSFLRGEGVLNNLEINEEVLNEVLSIPFLQVQRVHVNQLKCKLPSLTRLNNDPLWILMDHVTVEIIEPIEARPFKTPLHDFMKSMAPKSNQPAAASTKKYGFFEKLIDGIALEVKRVTVTIKTLGPTPSTALGEWTPPYLRMEIQDLKVETTNNNWRVLDLKYCLPKFDKNSPILYLYKRGVMKSLSVQLVHPNISDQGSKPHINAFSTVTLVEKISATVRISQKKKAVGGKFLGANVEILLGNVNISLQQSDISHLIRFLVGFQSATQRQDLMIPKIEYMKQKMKKKDSARGLDTTSTSTSTSSRNPSAAISKFIKTKQDSDELSELDMDQLSSEDTDLDTAQLIEVSKQVTSDGARTTISLVMNELRAELRNGPISFLFEVLGFHLSVTSPPHTITDKHIEMAIPYFHFRYVSANRNATSISEDTEDKALVDNIIGPKFKHRLYNLPQEELINDHKKFTVDMKLWPEFLPEDADVKQKRARYDSHMENPFALTFRRKFFEEGREMIRFKFIYAPQTRDFVLEMRVNPIQVVAHVKKLIKLTEYVLGSFPDLSIEPPEETKIFIPEVQLPVEKKKKKRREDVELDEDVLDNDEIEEENKVSFIIEVRDPSIVIPANSEISNFDGVSALLRIATKEVIVTSDPRIQRPSWTEENQPTLFVPKHDIDTLMYDFPSSSEDFTVFHRALWEVLPSKYKINLADFVIELLPSFTSPPQKIMEPLSLSFDLGVNDPTLSDFHRKLPTFIIMTRIEQLSFHFNQNQCILLLDLVKTYLDDPPEISYLLIQNTKKFAEQNQKIIMKKHGRVASEDRDAQPHSESEDEQSEEDIQDDGKDLLPLLILCKLDKLALSIALSSNNVAEIFDPNYVSNDAPMTSVEILGAECLVETHHISRKLVVKSRVETLKLLSPPPMQSQDLLDPASIIVAHKSLGRATKHVFYTLHEDEAETATGKKEYMIMARYEHPMHAVLNKDASDSVLYNRNYPMNPLLIFKLDGVHIGLNANSVFQIVKFLESRNNIFDTSPIEFMNQTVTRTVEVLKDKYLPVSKQAKNQSEEASPIQQSAAVQAIETQTDDLVLSEDSRIDTLKRSESQYIESETNSSVTTPDISDLPAIDIKEPESQEVDNISDTSSPSSSSSSNRSRSRSIAQFAKRVPVPFKSKTGEAVHPILWSLDITNVEIFVIQDITDPENKQNANAMGFEIEKLRAEHKPKTRGPMVLSKTYSATELLHPTLRESPPCYKTADYDFVMKFIGSHGSLTSIYFNPEVQKLVRNELSEPLDFNVEISSDYTQSILQKGILVEFSRYNKQEQEAQKWSVNVTPYLLSVITGLVTSQVEEVKQFAYLLKFLRRPAFDLAENFEQLQAEMNRTQRAITRALFLHDSLGSVFKTMQLELADKDDALQTVIQDKLRLTQQLAETMAVYANAKGPVKPIQIPPNTQQQAPQQTQLQVPQQQQPQQPKLSPRVVIIMEGYVSLLLQDSTTWRRVYGVLIGTELVFVTQKIPHNELRDSGLRKKYLFFQMKLDYYSEAFKTYAPVLDPQDPKKVLYVSDTNDVSIYINTQNDQAMADWSRVIEKTIQIRREEKAKQDEEERLEQERKEKEIREEQERLEKEEQERLEEERLEKEEQDRIEREREYDLQRGVASIGVQTGPDETEDSLTQEEFTTKQLSDLFSQFTIMKEGLQGAKEQQDELVVKMTDLTGYVKQLKVEEELRLDNIQAKVKMEVERAKQEEELRNENTALRELLFQRDRRIVDLESQVLRERKVVSRIKEEHQMLNENMRLHFMVVEDQLKQAQTDNNLLKRELDAFKSRSPNPPRKMSGKLPPPSPRDDKSDIEVVSSELKLIIHDLYEQLAKKDEEVNALKRKLVESQSRSSTPPKQVSEASPSTKSLPPVPTRKLSSGTHVNLPPVPETFRPTQHTPPTATATTQKSSPLSSKLASFGQRAMKQVQDKMEAFKESRNSSSPSPKPPVPTSNNSQQSILVQFSTEDDSVPEVEKPKKTEENTLDALLDMSTPSPQPQESVFQEQEQQQTNVVEQTQQEDNLLNL